MHIYVYLLGTSKLKNLTDAVRYIWVWVCLTYKVRPLVNQILKVYHELWEIKPKWQNGHIAGPPLGLQTCLDFLMAQIQQSAEYLP